MDGAEVEFPRFTRVNLPEHVYRDYITDYPLQEERMCHSSFIKLVRAMTRHNQKASKEIDYASRIFMCDTMNLMREIVNKITI